MTLRHLIISAFFITFFSSCQQSLEPIELRDWYYENQADFSQKKNFNGFQVELVHKPIEVKALESISRHRFNLKEFENNLASLKDMLFLELRFSASGTKDFLDFGIESEEEYNKRLQYFMAYPAEDIFIRTDSSKIPVASYHFERSDNLKPYQSVLLAFDFSNSSLDVYGLKGELHFNETVLGTGGIMFPLQPQNKLPKLNLDYDSK
ncbi:hypothetical protein [Croceimicrobium hydrocarbonivorans]|uniref:Lipoprotein n=1 Tax=Croceimicrobium hydrocarbonivorans TaxID=2761580 RepID=A0A7H0VBW1_9FLAO|nr:hypothetical protein [Croceimicrobium hydrocarbonivorans]QNR23209.1 hypothetical protein H4K34_12590 [Croceimicrobium hydrocarbonivorans]